MKAPGTGWQLDDWEWMRFAAEMPAVAVPLPTASGTGLLSGGRCILAGWSLQNTATTAGVITLVNGQDSSGMTIVTLGLAAAATDNGRPGITGVIMDVGLFYSVSTGTWKGAVFMIPLDHYPNTPPGR